MTTDTFYRATVARGRKSIFAILAYPHTQGKIFSLPVFHRSPEVHAVTIDTQNPVFLKTGKSEAYDLGRGNFFKFFAIIKKVIFLGRGTRRRHDKNLQRKFMVRKKPTTRCWQLYHFSPILPVR
jgi:hypothetical protein